MKNLFAIILAFIAIESTSQELWKNETDDFTGEVKKITESYAVAEGVSKLSIQVGRVNESYFFFATPSIDLGCSGAVGNYIIIKFTDGSTLKLEDKAKIDCDDDSSSLFVFTPSDFEGKSIEKFRLQHSEYYDDCLWTDEWCSFSFSDFLTAIK